MRRTKKTFITAPGDPAPLTLEVKHRLAFSEVDALAIGWHGHFPRFFEMAHTALMRKIGLTYDVYRKNQVGAPIVQLHTDYYAPLVLDELFTIRAEFVWSGGARINVNYEIIKENGDRTKKVTCGSSSFIQDLRELFGTTGTVRKSTS